MKADKLGVGIYDDSEQALSEGLRMPGHVFLLFDRGLEHAEAIRRLCPEGKLIGRIWTDQQQNEWLQGDPDLKGFMLAQMLLNHPANQFVDGWQSLNEVASQFRVTQLADFDRSFAQVMKAAGKIAVVGNFNPGAMLAGEFGSWTDILEMDNVWLNVHGYWHADKGPRADWELSLRHRLWKAQGLKLPPIFIGEFNTWNGYRADGLSAKEFGQQLADFADEIESDPDVVGAAIFCSGNSGGWQDYSISENEGDAATIRNVLDAAVASNVYIPVRINQQEVEVPRGEEEQNAINVVNGWSERLKDTTHKWTKDELAQAGAELGDVKEILERLFPLVTSRNR